MILSVVFVPELYGDAQIGPRGLKIQEHCQLVNCGSREEDFCCPVIAISDEFSTLCRVVFCTRF